MRMLYTIHGIDPAKVERIKAEMAILGAPVVRVVNCGDYLMALEATHRIAAATELGIAPVLCELEQDDLVESDSLDWPCLCTGQRYTAGELAGEAFSPSCGAYRITDGGTLQVEHQGRI
jgi:hypothetical protein